MEDTISSLAMEDTIAGNVLDDDADEDICRICRCAGEPGNPLRHPCVCRGTIKFIHEDCLLLWLKRRNISHCEVCKHVYSFTPIYAENAPARLSPLQFLLGVAVKVARIFRWLGHFVYVFSVWFLLIPFVTHLVWDLAFIRRFDQAWSLFQSYTSIIAILWHCAHGILLSFGLACFFLGFSLLEVVLVQRWRRGGRRLADRVPLANGNVEDGVGRQGVHRVVYVIGRYVGFLTAWWEVLVAPLLADAGIIENPNIVENPARNEVVQMRFLFLPFDENALIVVASNVVFISFVILLPFSLGRIVTLLQALIFSLARAQIFSSAKPKTEAALVLENVVKNASICIKRFSPYRGVQMPSLVSEGAAEILTEMDKASDGVNIPTLFTLYRGQVNGEPLLSDNTTLFIGYVIILSFILLYLGVVFTFHYATDESLTRKGLSSISFIIDGILALVRGFITLCRQVLTLVTRHFLATSKVTFVLGTRVGMFPFMCGWWLDVCTLRLFGLTITQRIVLSMKYPLWMSLAYWIVGICYLLCVCVHVVLIQEVLRDGVLYFLPNIAAPNYNFFQRMMRRPFHKHVCSLLLSVSVHGSLIVMLVLVPIKLVILCAPSVFPINVRPSDFQIFADILQKRFLLQFGLPCMIDFYFPSATFKALLHKWLLFVSSMLGLSDFLLRKHRGDGGNFVPVRQQRVVNLFFAIVEGSIVSTCSPIRINDTEVDRDKEDDSKFVLRITILVMLAWLSGLVYNSFLLSAPLVVGRAVYEAISDILISHRINYNDTYCIITGCCIMCTITRGAKHAVKIGQTRGVQVLVFHAWEWCKVAFESFIFILLLICVPILFGLVVDSLMIAPKQLSPELSLVFILFLDWILGFIFLVSLSGLVIIEIMVSSTDENWMVKLEKALHSGLHRQFVIWLLLEILLPLSMMILISTGVSCMLARQLFNMYGYPLMVKSSISWFVWPGGFTFSIMWLCAKKIYTWGVHMHNAIRDDYYLVENRLQDYGEDHKENPKKVENESVRPCLL